MALNIPNTMPIGQALTEGIQTGGNLFTQIMNPILKREQEQRMREQFEKELELRKQQQARLGANSDLTRQMMQQQLLALQHANDPNYPLQQYKALEDMIKSRGVPGQQMPMQEMGQGLGMFSPEGLQEAQQQAPMQQQMGEQGNNAGGIDMELLKKSPILQAGFKHLFKMEPFKQVPQTPEEKQSAALDLFKQKEKFKNEQEQKLPAAIKTLHENIIHLSPKAIDSIEHIINIPSPFEPWGLGAIKSGQKAAHNKAVTAAAENYSKAKGWPNTKGSIEKAESILQRGKFETDYDYRNRLREYQDELRQGIKSSNQFIHPNKQESETEQKSNNNIIEYVRRNGKIVPK